MYLVEKSRGGADAEDAGRLHDLDRVTQVLELRTAAHERAQLTGSIRRWTQPARDQKRVHAARDLEVLLQSGQWHEHGCHLALLRFEGELAE